jgi:hypothetical protein
LSRFFRKVIDPGLNGPRLDWYEACDEADVHLRGLDLAGACEQVSGRTRLSHGDDGIDVAPRQGNAINLRNEKNTNNRKTRLAYGMKTANVKHKENSLRREVHYRNVYRNL